MVAEIKTTTVRIEETKVASNNSNVEIKSLFQLP
jgi:hypothetical protein